MNFDKKNIVIGVTGSIAAYKTPELVRLLKAEGANVKVVMTQDAKQFITELTLQAVCGSPVHSQLLDPTTEASMSHITLAKWADLIVIVPATANVIAKLNAGIADDLLSTLYLASAAPTAIVPAMNQQMWRHIATQQNVGELKERGVLFWGPDEGSQACGDEGPGRMIEPSQILEEINSYFAPKLFQGKKIVITAGPTRERLDPVRYISNFSSGKMGYALAQAAKNLGAEVVLVSGPTQLSAPVGVATILVESADEMYQAVCDHLSNCEVFIGCAAVADFRSKEIAPQKIKKGLVPEIKLEKNIDIIQEIGSRPDKPFLVGFAAESENLVENAKAKLLQKNLDMVVANDISAADSGFNSDFNRVCVITADGRVDFDLMPKLRLAGELMGVICQRLGR